MPQIEFQYFGSQVFVKKYDTHIAIKNCTSIYAKVYVRLYTFFLIDLGVDYAIRRPHRSVSIDMLVLLAVMCMFSIESQSLCIL